MVIVTVAGVLSRPLGRYVNESPPTYPAAGEYV
jgi:hypothetical protein